MYQLLVTNSKLSKNSTTELLLASVISRVGVRDYIQYFKAVCLSITLCILSIAYLNLALFGLRKQGICILLKESRLLCDETQVGTEHLIWHA